MFIIMKDFGIDKGLVQTFDTKHKANKGIFFSLRKMFWDYLKKMNVPFSDPCCSEAAPSDTFPVRYNATSTRVEYYNGTAWVDIPTP